MIEILASVVWIACLVHVVRVIFNAAFKAAERRERNRKLRDWIDDENWIK